MRSQYKVLLLAESLFNFKPQDTEFLFIKANSIPTQTVWVTIENLAIFILTDCVSLSGHLYFYFSPVVMLVIFCKNIVPNNGKFIICSFTSEKKLVGSC